MFLGLGRLQAVVLEATRALAAEEVELGAALRRVLAAPVMARDPLPPFAASIMVRACRAPYEIHLSPLQPCSSSTHSEVRRLWPGSAGRLRAVRG